MTSRIYYSDQAEQIARRREIAAGIALLTLGLGVGATLALLFAPQEGTDTREMLKHAMEDGYDQGRDAARQALKQLRNDAPELRERIDNIIDNLRS